MCLPLSTIFLQKFGNVLTVWSLFSFYFITGKPTVLNGSTIYVFGNLGSISNVTFLVDCYPKPVISWIQILGGKLGTWNVIFQNGGKFNVQSTVLQSIPNHVGNYKALVRNVRVVKNQL